MKVILSRKGIDCSTGNVPSPIMPDGTLLSLPIPDSTSGKKYVELFYKGLSYQEIIRQLKPNFNFVENPTCHLDPDIYDDLGGRPAEWKSAFGQHNISATHLDNMGVDVGDVFLFFGMFRQTEYQSDGTLGYIRGAPIQHIIYGYMKVGEILQDAQEIIKRYPWHPHAVNPDRQNNRLYIPDTYGTFRYSPTLVLTKPGQHNRSLWALPKFFAENGVSISYHKCKGPTLVGDCAELQSVRQGQEFVITTSTTAQQQMLTCWVADLINAGIK